MAILKVGPGAQYSTISAAVAASKSGDIIQVQAGTYKNDFPPPINHDLTLEAAGGMVKMVATKPPPNAKGIFDVGGAGVNVAIVGFDLSGAKVSSGNGGNGAGIRYEGGNLTLVNDYVHDNQNGLLANADPTGTITINNSQFDHNGSGTGYTHNIYVGAINTLTVMASYLTGAVVGHELKSRAFNNFIENNRIQDGPTGTASYVIDLPNAGRAVIAGNVIEKGPKASNSTLIAYGEEGSVRANSFLNISGNTLLDDDASGPRLGLNNATGINATIAANSFFGLTANQVVSGPANVSGSTFLASEPTLDTAAPWSNGASGY